MSDTIRLTASDRESLMRLNVAYEILLTEGAHLERRLRMIDGGMRDWGLLKKKINQLMEYMTATIPEDQMMTYLRSMQMTSYTIGIKRPGATIRNEKDFGMWLSYAVINRLLDGCHDHCMMCSEDKAKRRACELRKALDEIPNDAPERDDDDCPYYTLM